MLVNEWAKIILIYKKYTPKNTKVKKIYGIKIIIVKLKFKN